MNLHETDMSTFERSGSLREFRSGIAPMSDRAYAEGLAAATEPAPAEKAGPAFGRWTAAAAAVVAVMVLGLQLSGGGTPSEAVAATVLDRAAVAASSAPPLDLPSQGWVYREILRQNGPSWVTVQVWESVDGSAPGLMTSTENGASQSTTLPVGDQSILASRSLSALEQLPDDPAKVLDDLRKDPATAADMSLNDVDEDVAVWEQIRALSERVPVQKQSVLFRAAQDIEGLDVESGVTDAAGRSGTALGLDDPRLGIIQLVFSDEDGRLLGERILQRDNRSTQFSSSVTNIAVVPAIGDVPAPR
ncbi:MAG: hypothetical protein WBG53_10785 [Rhodococcus sp. (in: high G+C Gram-positive bacteria)]